MGVIVKNWNREAIWEITKGMPHGHIGKYGHHGFKLSRETMFGELELELYCDHRVEAMGTLKLKDLEAMVDLWKAWEKEGAGATSGQECEDIKGEDK
jgi:hypothetical protein